MIRLKIIKATKHYKIGEVVEVDNNEAFGLLDSGSAIKSKDMVATFDYPIAKIRRIRRKNK